MENLGERHATALSHVPLSRYFGESSPFGNYDRVNYSPLYLFIFRERVLALKHNSRKSAVDTTYCTQFTASRLMTRVIIPFVQVIGVFDRNYTMVS